ncbi:MAG TPA: glycosyltransferase family 39 protein [Thermoleophilaceae bacterium]
MVQPAAGRRALAPVASAVVAVTAAAALLRFWAIGRQGFWYDEATTAWLLRGSLGQMLARLPHTESTPPLYYLVAWGWVRLFGDTETGLRSLSALAGIATVPVAFAAARTLAGRRVALLAAGLVAVNPFLVWYSQEARSYALLVFTSALALWLFARVRARPTAGGLALWAAAAVASLCTHYFAVFLVAPQAILLLADRRVPVRWRLGAVAGVGVPALALFVLARAQSVRTYYFIHTPLGVRVEQIPQFFIAGFTPPATRAVLLVGGVAVLAGCALLVLRADRAELRAALVAGGLGGAAVLVPVVLAVGGADYLNARNVIAALVPLLIALACGFAASRARLVGAAAAMVLVVVSLAMVMAVPGDAGAQRAHWQEVAKELRFTGRPRAIMLLGAHTWSRILGFYLRDIWWDPPHGRRVSEIDVLRRSASYGACPVVVWWGPSCDSAPHPPLAHPPAPGFRFASETRVAGFAIDRYVSPRAVRLYAHAPFEHRVPADSVVSYRQRGRLMVMPRKAPPVP